MIMIYIGGEIQVQRICSIQSTRSEFNLNSVINQHTYLDMREKIMYSEEKNLACQLLYIWEWLIDYIYQLCVRNEIRDL